MIEVKNPTGLKLTKDDDGVFLHYESGKKKAAIILASLLTHGPVVNECIKEWAEKLRTVT